jgi:hypothetical protein
VRPFNFSRDPLAVKRALKARGIFYRDIAEKAGVTVMFVMHVIGGWRRSSHVEAVIREALGGTRASV